MNTDVKAKHSISSLFIFLLIGLYAVFVLLLVVIGVGAYRNKVNESRNTAQVRTSLGYIANVVRASDQIGGVSIEEWQGVDSLLIREWHDGSEYNRRIYYLPNEADSPSGALYEQFVFAGDEWPREEGDRIADIAALDMRFESGLLSLLLQTEDGQTLPLRMRLHAAAR
jgi:hypothetical protein